MANGSPLRGPGSEPIAGDGSRSKDSSQWGTVKLSGQPTTPSSAVWLTAGEAADAAHVSHRQISAWIATEDLTVRTGWRGGAEIRLVLLSDLEGLADQIHVDRVRESLAERGVVTGPRHSVPGGEQSGDLRDAEGAHGDGTTLEPGEQYKVKPEDRGWALELEQEVRRLRRVVQTLREDHETLERHLDERPTVVATRRLGGLRIRTAPKTASTSDAVAASDEPVAAPEAVPERVAEVEHSVPTLVPWGPIVATVAGLLLGWLGATLVTGWGESGAGSGEGAVEGAGPGTVLAADRTEPGFTQTSASDAASRKQQLASLANVSVGTKSLAPSVDSSGAGPISFPSTGKSPSTGPSATLVFSQPAAELAGDASGAAVEQPTIEAGAPARLRPPVALASIEKVVFSRRSAILADCAYSALVERKGAIGDVAGELVLGPCFGPARTGSSGFIAVPGTHRVGSVACCRHHAFVERMTSAATEDSSLAGLRAEAKASMADGVLPPLFRLRADRSAARFLREETRGWERAGLDGAAGQLRTAALPHDWKRLVAQPKGGGVRVELDSWVEPVERFRPDASTVAKAPKVRRFRMTLLVQSAPDGDVLESFEWLPGE